MVSAVPQRLLVVEDNDDLRELFRQGLICEGFQVDAVGDGLAAVRAIERSLPDLLLLDLAMPRLNGFEVIARLRAGGDATRNLPILVVTAQGPAAAETALRLGANRAIEKPCDPADLSLLVRAMLDGHSAART